jgi:signal transduction histidine kinase/CheY-like chemotaxis protein
MAFSLVCGVGLFGALAYLDRLNTLDEAKENLRRTVTLMEGHARVAIQAEGVVLSDMASLLNGTDADALRHTPGAWERLLRLKGEMPSIQSLWVLDPKGDVALTSIQRDPPGVSLKDREYFAVHTGPADVGTFISPMIWGRLTGGFLFAVSRAVRAPDGTLRAVVESSIDAGHFTSFYESLKPPLGTSFTLFRDDGDVVLRFPLPATEGKINSSGSHLFTTLLKEAPEGTFFSRSTIDGVQRLGAYKRMDGWPLVVFTGVPVDTVFDAWWARTQRNALLTGGVLTALCGMIGFGIRNVRRERRAEAAALEAKDHALRAKAEAERANLAKSKFLAAASHDLRQPVQSLVLLLASVEQHARERPALAKSVAMMERALGALNRLLSSLLDVSRLDAGVVTPTLDNVAVGDLLDKLGGEYRLRAEQKGLRLRTVAAQAWVRSDAVLLERVLRNLIENALQYTSEGGILLGCRRRGGKVLLQVFDSGAGIPEDQQETVFEEFFQMHNPGRDQAKGLGLGLAIVKRIARLLGATVEVRSAPGHGSCFTVTLEEVAAPQGRALPAAHPAVPVGGSILIIEDDGIVRIGLQMMAETWGHRAVAVASGEEAVDLVTGRRFDPEAVVADYRLGEGMTGVEAVLAIRRALGRAVPAVMVTGDTAPERIQEVHASGIGILHKPYGAEELRRRLSDLLADRTRAADAGAV